jgi:hypothetical protein
MNISNISPPIQSDGTIHPTIAARYAIALDWLRADMTLQNVVDENCGDRKLDRQVIEQLFNLVPVTSMSAERLKEEDAQRMLDILVGCLEDGYFLKVVQCVSLEEIAANHPDGIMAKTKVVDVGGRYIAVTRNPSRIDWLDALVARNPAMTLRYLGGLNLEGLGDYAKDYFKPLAGHPALLDGLDSQRALKFYKTFGWQECIPRMRENEAAQALEIDLGL